MPPQLSKCSQNINLSIKKLKEQKNWLNTKRITLSNIIVKPQRHKENPESSKRKFSHIQQNAMQGRANVASETIKTRQPWNYASQKFDTHQTLLQMQRENACSDKQKLRKF
jgi:hypothetical protein